MPSLSQIDGRLSGLLCEWDRFEAEALGLKGRLDNQASRDLASGNPDASIDNKRPVSVVDEVADQRRGMLPSDGMRASAASAKQDDAGSILWPFGPQGFDPIAEVIHVGNEDFSAWRGKGRIEWMRLAAGMGSVRWMKVFRNLSDSGADYMEAAWSDVGFGELGRLLRGFAKPSEPKPVLRTLAAESPTKAASRSPWARVLSAIIGRRLAKRALARFPALRRSGKRRFPHVSGADSAPQEFLWASALDAQAAMSNRLAFLRPASDASPGIPAPAAPRPLDCPAGQQSPSQPVAQNTAGETVEVQQQTSGSASGESQADAVGGQEGGKALKCFSVEVVYDLLINTESLNSAFSALKSRFPSDCNFRIKEISTPLFMEGVEEGRLLSSWELLDLTDRHERPAPLTPPWPGSWRPDTAADLDNAKLERSRDAEL